MTSSNTNHHFCARKVQALIGFSTTLDVPLSPLVPTSCPLTSSSRLTLKKEASLFNIWILGSIVPCSHLEIVCLVVCISIASISCVSSFSILSFLICSANRIVFTTFFYFIKHTYALMLIIFAHDASNFEHNALFHIHFRIHSLLIIQNLLEIKKGKSQNKK